MGVETKKSRAEYNRQWRLNNPEKVKATRERNRENRIQQTRKWRERVRADPGLRRQQSKKSVEYHRRKKAEDPIYAAKSKAREKRHYERLKQDPAKAEKLRERSRDQYHARKKDPERYQAYLSRARDYLRERKKNDPEFAIRGHLRSRLSDMVRRGRCTRNKKAVDLTGATIPELRSHLERQFKRGMSWRNYGSKWHIDHIIPCAHFDLTDPRQQAICFNYLNLRPCWAKENMRKNNRILHPSQLPLGI